MTITNVNQQNFEAEVLKSDETVVVDFWAEWCPPCKAIAPAYTELANEIDGAKFTKFEIVGKDASIVKQYGGKGIPFFIIFKNGEVIAHKSGAKDKADVADFLNENLPK